MLNPIPGKPQHNNYKAHDLRIPNANSTASCSEQSGLVEDAWRLPPERARGQCHFPNSRNLLIFPSTNASQEIVAAYISVLLFKTKPELLSCLGLNALISSSNLRGLIS